MAGVYLHSYSAAPVRFAHHTYAFLAIRASYYQPGLNGASLDLILLVLSPDGVLTAGT